MLLPLILIVYALLCVRASVDFSRLLLCYDSYYDDHCYHLMLFSIAIVNITRVISITISLIT